jgi:hypothetical protein
MPIDELLLHEKIYPTALVRLVVGAVQQGWAQDALVAFEDPK